VNDANPYESPDVIDQPREVPPAGFSLTEVVGMLIIISLSSALAFHWLNAVEDNSRAERWGRVPTRRPAKIELPADSKSGELPQANITE
jgi:hypothetical protein